MLHVSIKKPGILLIEVTWKYMFMCAVVSGKDTFCSLTGTPAIWHSIKNQYHEHAICTLVTDTASVEFMLKLYSITNKVSAFQFPTKVNKNHEMPIKLFCQYRSANLNQRYCFSHNDEIPWKTFPVIALPCMKFRCSLYWWRLAWRLITGYG